MGNDLDQKRELGQKIETEIAQFLKCVKQHHYWSDSDWANAELPFLEQDWLGISPYEEVNWEDELKSILPVCKIANDADANTVFNQVEPTPKGWLACAKFIHETPEWNAELVRLRKNDPWLLKVMKIKGKVALSVALTYLMKYGYLESGKPQPKGVSPVGPPTSQGDKHNHGTKSVDTKKRDKILDLRAKGHSYGQIHKKTGYTEASIAGYIRRHGKKRNLAQPPKTSKTPIK